MIEAIVESRCTGCNACVAVCPSDVFVAAASGPPIIARPDQCQTCFMCELYCAADAIYVGPNAEAREGARAEAMAAAGALGHYRRDSGWDEWGLDPRYANAHWRMDEIFARARAATQST